MILNYLPLSYNELNFKEWLVLGQNVDTYMRNNLRHDLDNNLDTCKKWVISQVLQGRF